MTMNENQQRLLKLIVENDEGSTCDVRPKIIFQLAEDNDVPVNDARHLLQKMNKIDHGVYNYNELLSPTQDVFSMVEDETEENPIDKPPIIANINSDDVFVPSVIKSYVKWGHFKDIVKIIQSQQFYPLFVTGLSGNGKTMMVEQACASLKRQYSRVQITPETDEDDLIGGFRLDNGDTVFSEGPVIRAMKAGAVLCLDEIDRGSNRIMCLQGVLEGNPVLIKKTGEIVYPAKGFTVIATANTKGRGSDDGRFIAANIIDEAFLERFNITIEQQYPTASVEKRIILKHMKIYGKIDEDFAQKLVSWSQTIRKSYEDDAVDDLISTRRLCHIAQTFAIFEDRLKSISLCIARFDDISKDAFMNLYTKIDAEVDDLQDVAEAKEAEKVDMDVITGSFTPDPSQTYTVGANTAWGNPILKPIVGLSNADVFSEYKEFIESVGDVTVTVNTSSSDPDSLS